MTAKLWRFLDDSALRGILSKKNTPDLARLSRGSVGTLAARLLGMILLHKLERLTLAREALPAARRRPLHIYVDEFHELATESLPGFLAAARKFNVGLTLANPGPALVSARMTEAVLAAAGSFVLFRQEPGPRWPEIVRLAGPRFDEPTLASLPNFAALGRTATPDRSTAVLRLSVPPPGPGSERTARLLRARSRRRHGRPRKIVSREVAERLQWGRENEDNAEGEEAHDEQLGLL